MKYLVVTFFLYASVESFLDYSYVQPAKIVKRRASTTERYDGDTGDPLYLTKYVENGNIDEGRRLARVPFTEDFNIKSYAGFFTVNKKYFSNQFFWYFPPINNEKQAPVLVWLQGGPGGSSLYGLLIENGPLQVNGDKLEKREINWAINHHVIYIDNPVGTGFSSTDNTEGYCTNEVQVGDQLYSTLIQFFQLFPELQSNDFFITGESYAGKYVPALAYTIHERNPEAKVKINLKGLVMGNAWSDPIHQLVYGEYLYQMGLIDWNQMKNIETYRVDLENYIKKEDWNAAWLSQNIMMGALVYYTGLENLYNHQTTKNTTENLSDYAAILLKTCIRKGLHVGGLPYRPMSYEVQEHLKLDMLQSVVPWISALLDHYDVFIYNGQLDIIVAYPLTVNYLRHLNFSGAEEYKTAKRYIWHVDEDVAGYVKTAGRLTEIMVRNAGHMVPRDQPKFAWDMITRITHGKGFLDY